MGRVCDDRILYAQESGLEMCQTTLYFTVDLT